MPSNLRSGSGQANSTRAAIVLAALCLALGLSALSLARPAHGADAPVGAAPGPGVSIAVTGPAAAVAGELLSYSLAVTNSGSTAFAADLVIVTDPQCQSSPATLSRNGDKTPATLDRLDTWTYSCQVPTQRGQERVDNSAAVTATDGSGQTASATASAATVLTQPGSQTLASPRPVSPRPARPAAARAGRARLRGTAGCATAKYARTSVSGTGIRRVRFYDNGKLIRTVNKANRGRSFAIRIRVRGLEYGAHRITARVQFVRSSQTRARTLKLRFRRCKPRMHGSACKR